MGARTRWATLIAAAALGGGALLPVAVGATVAPGPAHACERIEFLWEHPTQDPVWAEERPEEGWQQSDEEPRRVLLCEVAYLPTCPQDPPTEPAVFQVTNRTGTPVALTVRSDDHVLHAETDPPIPHGTTQIAAPREQHQRVWLQIDGEPFGDPATTEETLAEDDPLCSVEVQVAKTWEVIDDGWSSEQATDLAEAISSRFVEHPPSFSVELADVDLQLRLAPLATGSFTGLEAHRSYHLSWSEQDIEQFAAVDLGDGGPVCTLDRDRSRLDQHEVPTGADERRVVLIEPRNVYRCEAADGDAPQPDRDPEPPTSEEPEPETEPTPEDPAPLPTPDDPTGDDPVPSPDEPAADDDTDVAGEVIDDGDDLHEGGDDAGTVPDDGPDDDDTTVAGGRLPLTGTTSAALTGLGLLAMVTGMAVLGLTGPLHRQRRSGATANPWLP